MSPRESFARGKYSNQRIASNKKINKIIWTWHYINKITSGLQGCIKLNKGRGRGKGKGKRKRKARGKAREKGRGRRGKGGKA